MDRAWASYSDRFRKDVLPKLLDSSVFLSIGTEPGNFDVTQATELGAALLCNKPLLLLCPRGRTLNPRLVRAADVVVEDWDANDPAAAERISAAIATLEGLG